MKITYSNENINSFGGINFADHIIDSSSMLEIINQESGERGSRATYNHSDLVRSYFLFEHSVVQVFATKSRQLTCGKMLKQA